PPSPPGAARRARADSPTADGAWRTAAAGRTARGRGPARPGCDAGWSGAGRRSHMPDAAKDRAGTGASPRLGVAPTGLPVSPADLPERVDLEAPCRPRSASVGRSPARDP